MHRTAATSFFLAFYALSGVSSQQHVSKSPLASTVNSTANVCVIEPGAKVSDACASYADLDQLNTRLHPHVRKLVSKTDFFSYYRLNLYNKVCPFWSDENGVCGNVACAVTTLDNEAEIPPTLRAEELSRLEGPKAHHPGKVEQKQHPEKPLHGELGADVQESCVVEYDDECDERDYCVPEDESSSAKGDYVSLVDNPERFTGYAGEGAHQVWEAIYRENCFSRPSATDEESGKSARNPFAAMSGPKAEASNNLRAVLQEHGRQQALQQGSLQDQIEFDDECVEKRVFHRIISGMHASISTHLCHDYLNQTTGQWGPNLQCYKERIHTHPERVSNVYFNYALVTRAVGKLKDYVQDYTFCSGDAEEDRKTKDMISSLSAALPAGPDIFDERVMFQNNALDTQGLTLKEDFRNRFRNVSRIMDCVGCDKCRLWGKLQTVGYGTALKVLFEFGQDDTTKPLLRRTELIALVNTLDKISHALTIMGDFRALIDAEQESGTKRKTVQQKLLVKSHHDDEEMPAENPASQQTIQDTIHNEWQLIWSTFVDVLDSWIHLPQKL